ncbi:hypothetical protein K3K61_004359 [Salmonella enterica subsp. enterica serovar Mikawasima]|nr:hypothetical protein [Salmonella enterica subsp. enterica serovar Mikawasima]
MRKIQRVLSEYYHAVTSLLKIIILPFIILFYVLPAGFVFVLKKTSARLRGDINENN